MLLSRSLAFLFASQARLHVLQYLVLTPRQLIFSPTFAPTSACPCGQCVFFWFLPRPLRIMSSVFCLCVPRYRWLGFTHNILSHLWQMIFPNGISPLVLIQDKRCAEIVRYLRVVFPYPFFPTLPTHSQQSSAAPRLTLSQKSKYLLPIKRLFTRKGGVCL